MTVTLILTANTAATYGDACSVDGNSISNGVEWSGGSPTATSNMTFLPSLSFEIVAASLEYSDKATQTSVRG